MSPGNKGNDKVIDFSVRVENNLKNNTYKEDLGIPAHRLRAGDMSLNELKFMMKISNYSNCERCSIGDVHHLLTECVRFQSGKEVVMRLMNLNKFDTDPVWSITGRQSDDKVYTYNEAIDLAGSGWYIYALLAVLALAQEGMALDIFGLSVIVNSACDLELSHAQKSILLSMPFLGCVIMSYPWGYIADTQGRLKGLSISMWGSFILASISAFSPNWIVFAVLRLSSSSLSSGAHSLSITLLGESCSSKSKGPLMIGVSTLLFYTFGIYSATAYFVLNHKFAFDFGFIVFTPWRLLTLVLAMPLGISALSSTFFYESPKFLLNAGHEKSALKVLRKISEINGIKVNKYPVNRMILDETKSLRRKDIPFVLSLMNQIFPLFRPPLLYRTIQLFFITAVIFSTNNGFYSWLPFVADRLSSGFDEDITNDNLCRMISNYHELNNTSACIETVTEFTVQISLLQGVVYSLLNFVVLWLSWRKKIVLITLLLTSFACGVSIPLVPGMSLSIFLFYGSLLNFLCMSIIFSYYVDIFPTSFRGMAACLGVMVARLSGLFGMNLVGTYLVSHCSYTFYIWSAVVFSGVIASIFLPPDKPKK